jgi:hypothetical protein
MHDTGGYDVSIMIHGPFAGSMLETTSSMDLSAGITLHTLQTCRPIWLRKRLPTEMF